MKLEYSVSKEDYFRYCMYSYDHSDIAKKQVMMVRLVFAGVILLITLVALFFQLTDNPLLYSIILWIVCAALVANTKRSMRNTNEKQYRKQINDGRGSEFIGDYTLELSEDRLTLLMQSRKSEIDYNAVERVEQDEFCMYIYCGSMSAVLIPLSAFRDSHQREELLDDLKRKCPKIN